MTEPNTVLAAVTKRAKPIPPPPPQTASNLQESPSGVQGLTPRGNPGGSQPLTAGDGRKQIAEMKARLADLAMRAELSNVPVPSRDAIAKIRQALQFSVDAEIVKQLDALRADYREAWDKVLEFSADNARRSYAEHHQQVREAVAGSDRDHLRGMDHWTKDEWLAEAATKCSMAKDHCKQIGRKIHELLKPSFIEFADRLEQVAGAVVEREYDSAVELGLADGWKPSNLSLMLRRGALMFRDHAASNSAAANPPAVILAGLIDEPQTEGAQNEQGV